MDLPDLNDPTDLIDPIHPLDPIDLLHLSCLFYDLAYQRLIVHRHDDHAGVADGVTAAILVGVVADHGAARDQHVAVDDGVANLRVPPHADARHQDRSVDRAVAVHAHVGTQHAAGDLAA